MIRTDVRLEYSSTVAWVGDARRVVLLDLTSGGTGTPNVLAGGGSLIWFELGARPTLDDLVDVIAARVELLAADVRPDVYSFIGELIDRGWIREVT